MGHKSLRSLSGMQIQVLSGKDRNIWDHLRKIWNTCGHLEIQHQSTETFQGSSCRILTNGHRQGLQFRVLHPTWKGQKKKLSTATSSAARYSITATRRWRPLYSRRSFWDGSKMVKKVCCHMYFIQLTIYIFYIWYMYAYVYIYIYTCIHEWVCLKIV